MAMREHHLTTQRTARYYALGGGRELEVWFALHGYSQLARYFIRPFEAIADATRLVVAPEALNRYYFETGPGEHASDARVAATWMTREDREHEITDYIAYLDHLADTVLGGLRGTASAGDLKVVVLGFSQGAATASRWAARGRTRIDRLVLWGSSIAHELVPAPDLFRGAELSIVVGRSDPRAQEPQIEAESQRLRGSGLEHALLRFDGGHRVEAEPLVQLADFQWR